MWLENRFILLKDWFRGSIFFLSGACEVSRDSRSRRQAPWIGTKGGFKYWPFLRAGGIDYVAASAG